MTTDTPAAANPAAPAERIARQLRLRTANVAAAIELFDAGNTLPFVARYRKEATGGLDEEQLRAIGGQLAQWRALDERRATVLAEIESQGKLTPSLRQAILAAESRTVLEDLYLPFRPKRRTRAGVARERGLQPLAELIVQQPPGRESALELAAPYAKGEVATPEDALAGARDIVAELISDNADVRREVRERALKFASLVVEKNPEAADKDERGVYRDYYEFNQRVDRVRAHQALAINRGEREKVLRARVDIAERDWREPVEFRFRSSRRSPLGDQLQLAINEAAERLLLPAIARDVRRALGDKAETHAIGVFSANLRGLLSQPPLPGRVVLGIDPGQRTGCKFAVVDPTGKVLETGTIYPHPPRRDWAGALAVLAALVESDNVSLITIGNGTASRETERLVAELIRERLAGRDVRYLIVSEAGASVYSASPLARAELSQYDVSLRGAVSIARRAQDPLAELVKIDPQSLGVGLYQHDVEKTRLREALAGVVESVVNQVGVDANTASPALLTYVSGIGPKLAEAIVAHRDAHGPFPSREALREVEGLGPKTWEQAAGFLPIRGGLEPLDASAIHPESYPAARAVMARAGLSFDQSPEERAAALAPFQAPDALRALAGELGPGAPTLTDILEQLIRPGRDPREDLPAPLLRSDVLSLADLQPGMRLQGTVRNVVDFGAFIDIGVKQEGLLHRSRLPRGARLVVGDIVEVEVLSVDRERKRISLGWPRSHGEGEGEAAPEQPAAAPRSRGGRRGRPASQAGAAAPAEGAASESPEAAAPEVAEAAAPDTAEAGALPTSEADTLPAVDEAAPAAEAPGEANPPAPEQPAEALPPPPAEPAAAVSPSPEPAEAAASPDGATEAQPANDAG